MNRKRWKMCALLCVTTFLLSGCVIVWHDAQEGQPGYQPDSLGNRAYQSEDYAQATWQAELLPYMRENAVEIGVLRDAIHADAAQARANYGSRAKGAMNGEAFIAKGTATILSADTQSSTGLLVLDIDQDNNADCAVQIGPVIKTTALRDCAPFIRFDMFADQMAFAGVNKALNKLVVSDVVGERDFSASVGKSVTFLGAFSDMDEGEGLMLIVPVQLDEA